MKRIVGLLVLMGLAACASAGEPVIRLRADSWAPYNGDGASDRPGYAIEIAKAVFGKAGYTVDYTCEGWSWSRAIEECRRGAVEGIVCATRREIPDFIFPSESVGLDHNVFYVRKGSAWRYAGPDSLATVCLGAISDYGYGETVAVYVDAHKADEARIQLVEGEDALALNAGKLLEGRIDVLVENAAVFAAYVADANLADKFEAAGETPEREDLYIAFSPAHPDSATYADILTKGIAELRASGELARILARYGVADWAK